MEAKEAQDTFGAQRAQWDEVAAGWQKWDAWLDKSFEAFDRKLIDKAEITEGNFVVDLGSGTGYPSVRIAERIGRAGFVVGLDFSEQMVEVARSKARQLHLINVGFRVADISKILIADSQLDAIVSRFALMFVPDPEKTLKEVLRTLKRGKMFVAAVWGPSEKNPLPMSVLNQFLNLPPADASAPGPFRFSEPGNLAGLFENAGFADVTEEAIVKEDRYSTGEEYAQQVLDRYPLRAQLMQLTQETLHELQSKLASAAEERRQGQEIVLTRTVLLVSGRRPGKQ